MEAIVGLFITSSAPTTACQMDLGSGNEMVWDSGNNISSGSDIESNELGLGLWLQHQLQFSQCHRVP